MLSRDAFVSIVAVERLVPLPCRWSVEEVVVFSGVIVTPAFFLDFDEGLMAMSMMVTGMSSGKIQKRVIHT